MNTFKEYLKSQEGNLGTIWLKSGAKFPTTLLTVYDDYILIQGKDIQEPSLSFPIDVVASWQPLSYRQ